MNAYGRINKLVLFGNLDSTVERSRTISCADREHVSDSSFARMINHLLSIRIEALAIKMAMGIDKHDFGLAYPMSRSARVSKRLRRSS